MTLELAAFAPLLWGLAGLVSVHRLDRREERRDQVAGPVASSEPDELRPAA